MERKRYLDELTPELTYKLRCKLTFKLTWKLTFLRKQGLFQLTLFHHTTGSNLPTVPVFWQVIGKDMG